MIYVVPFHMVEWVGKARTKIATTCPLLHYSADWNHTMVKSWGTYKAPLEHHVLVDQAFLAKHPDVLQSLIARKLPVLVGKKKKVRRKPPEVPDTPVTLQPVIKPKRGRPRLVPANNVSESKLTTNSKPILQPAVVKPVLEPVVGMRRSRRVATRK